MKILVVLAVGVLGCSLAGAVTVSKCDLMEQLMTSIKSLPENIQQSGLTSKDFVAKIVCHVEQGSKFNTSAVTEMSCGQGGSSEEAHQAGSSGGSHKGNSGGGHEGNSGGSHEGNSGGGHEGNSGGSSGGSHEGNSGGGHEGNSGGHHRRRRSPPGWLSREEADKNLTLYGLFQLCGDLVCNNGTADSTNLCNIKCSDLTDDNIDDDISCVLNLLTEIVQNGFQAQNLSELRKVIRLIMPDDCKDVKADFYFAECTNVTQILS